MDDAGAALGQYSDLIVPRAASEYEHWRLDSPIWNQCTTQTCAADGISMQPPIEIRCPIYGFIRLSDWEREIISQPAFQRLRRIRQLAWTDYVYPGAMHTRFEHSLGVMHMATLLYDSIVARSWSELQDLGYKEAGKERNRQLVRLAALLHDVGHGPFSHAAEELAPTVPDNGRPFRHEEYSTAIIEHNFKDVIENHPENISNYRFKIDEITGLIKGGASVGQAALWQDLISGQIDADRMDYLLRDGYHAGVEYGRYDWRRMVATVQIVTDPESGAPKIGVGEDGRHAAEAMIIARYMMFNQVYFHKTRVILDYHLQAALGAMLPGGRFSAPTASGISEYLEWDDWRVLGNLLNQGGEHGARLVKRDFFRVVWQTPEFPTEDDEANLNEVESKLGELVAARLEASKSWYKVGGSDLLVFVRKNDTRPLSLCSTIVGQMEPSRLTRLYVRIEDRAKARQIIDGVGSS